MFLRWAALRFRGAQFALARGSVFAFDAALLASYALSFTWLLSKLHIPTKIGSVLGAAALFYGLLATAWVVFHSLTEFVLQRWATADPERRRIIRLAGKAAMV